MSIFRISFVGFLGGLLVFNVASAQRMDAGVMPVIIDLLLDDSDLGAITKTVRLAWTAPVARTDNSMLAQIDLENYRLRYRRQDTDTYRYRIISPAAERTTLNLRGDEGDIYELSLQVIDTAGSQSAYTTPITISFSAE